MTNTNFPQFAKYACLGDSITWQCEGFDITARIEFDHDTRPDHFECYSEASGGYGERVNERSQLLPALERAMKVVR